MARQARAEMAAGGGATCPALSLGAAIRRLILPARDCQRLINPHGGLHRLRQLLMHYAENLPIKPHLSVRLCNIFKALGPIWID
jgi:hypothetical protein